MKIDLHVKELFVRIHLRVADGNTVANDYPGMYAFHNNEGRVVVKAYGDPRDSIPRAVFEPGYAAGVEHFGDHITAQAEMKKARETRRQDRQKKEPFVVDEREMAKDREVLPQVLRNAVDTFGKDEESLVPVSALAESSRVVEEIDGGHFARLTPAEMQPEEKKFLEEVPKAESEPSTTDPEPTSALPMVVTPSGRFATSLPLTPEEEEVERRRLALTSSTATVGWNEPFAPGALDNRETRRAKAKGSHKKARQLPGATLLVALALSLSVLFRHPGQ